MNQKHIIIVEVDDELPDIYEKLKSSRAKEIHLFVPKQAILLSSLMNLKILKRKSEEMKKTITMITREKRNIARIEQSGFPVIEDKSFDPAQKKDPTDGTETAKKSGLGERWRKFFGSKNDDNRKPYIFNKPSRGPLFLFILFSTVLFFLVLYIALPSATVYLKPSLKLQKSSLNVELVEASRIGKITSAEDKVIPLYPVNIEYERTIKLTPTGRIFKGQRSTGTVTLLNTTSEPRPIVANSRLQTSDGLVFLTRNFVTIPGGSAARPGQIGVEVTAREKDAADAYIGARGNIGPSRFFFPGLSRSNQQLIFATSQDAFKGGTDDYEYFVTKKDLDIGRQKVTAELESSSIAELKKEISKKQTNDGSSLKLFERSDKLIGKNLLNSEVKAKENERRQEFDSTGRMRANGFYYNEVDLERILLTNLTLKHVSPTEKIIKVQDNSLQINEILETAPEIPRVKVNTSLEGIVAYDFLNTKLELVKQIRDNIIGKTKDEAQRYIDNLKEINEARISLWPIWTPTLPTIPENIKIEVEE